MDAKKLISNHIVGIASFFVAFSFICFMYGLLVPNSGDPYVGSFDVYNLDSGWTLTVEGEEGTEEVELPLSRNDLVGKTIYLKNTLPEDIKDGMELSVRSSMNDTCVYVGGRIRSSYSTAGYYNMVYHLPSAYMLCDLTGEDAGSEVVIKVFMKTTGAVSPIIYGYSGNIFYNIHENSKNIVFIGYIMLFVGLITVFVFLILKRRTKTPGYILFIGELTTTMGLWLLSETHLRQWIFASQAPTRLYAYLTIESVGVLACLYFDSVQEGRYHRYYFLCEIVSLSILIVSSILAVTGLVDFYRSLPVSHIFFGVGIIVTVITIVIDVIHGYIRRYRAIFIGIILFLISCVVELIHFYSDRMAALGLYIAIGMILLLFCTIIQMVINEIIRNANMLRDQEHFALRTLEAFAGSIDAREEYTGGHSFRVAEYATKLATAAASKYNFTDDDLREIHYIGVMHDIGKIALPDSILNCKGRLTEEEFSLVKQHVVIGEQLLKSLKHSRNLLDGVRYHHERYDGSGYPDGLSGEEIPVIARILAIADSYDAMTSQRVFREPMTGAMAKAEIIACAGSQFDPGLAETFCNLIDRKIIFPIEYEGIESDEGGEPLQSAMLQLMLRKNALSHEEEPIKEPSHVRTACFTAGVAEKNNSKVDMYIAGLSGTATPLSEEDARRLLQVKDYLNRTASLHDLILEYSYDRLLLIYIDRKDSEIADILSNATAYVSPAELSVRRLSVT